MAIFSVTSYCEVLEVSGSGYLNVVIKDLENDYLEIITIFPNWNGTIPSKGAIGYLKYREVAAGDEYVTSKGERLNFKYNMTFFEKFVYKTKDKDELTI
jgi:hypothetical protein